MFSFVPGSMFSGGYNSGRRMTQPAVSGSDVLLHLVSVYENLQCWMEV
jgi:hypothetical protein